MDYAYLYSIICTEEMQIRFWGREKYRRLYFRIKINYLKQNRDKVTALKSGAYFPV